MHARSHAPQVPGALSEASQPLAGLPSQSAKPALHTMPHAPAAHVAVALARAGHALPQRPQWAAWVATLTHAAPHATRPVAQLVAHAPALHTMPAPHARPQAPQWAPLFMRSTSQPLAAARSQSAQPVAQAPTAHAHHRRHEPSPVPNENAPITDYDHAP